MYNIGTLNTQAIVHENIYNNISTQNAIGKISLTAFQSVYNWK